MLVVNPPITWRAGRRGDRIPMPAMRSSILAFRLAAASSSTIWRSQAEPTWRQSATCLARSFSILVKSRRPRTKNETWALISGSSGQRRSREEAWRTLGTYRPVGNWAAKAFAWACYVELLMQKSIGAVLLAGRKKVRAEIKCIDFVSVFLPPAY